MKGLEEKLRINQIKFKTIVRIDMESLAGYIRVCEVFDS